MKSLVILFAFLSSLALASSPYGTPVESTVTCGTSNGTLVAANSNRGYILIQNQGSDTTGYCHLKFGSAITGTEGLWLKSGQNYEAVFSFVKSAIYCKCDSASQTLEVLEADW